MGEANSRCHRESNGGAIVSCYIVETSVMQKVVNAFRMTEATFLGCEHYDQLGRELYDLNARAYAKRYRESFGIQTLAFRYRDKCKPPYTAAERLKAVECLMYQCADAPNYENEPLWKRLEELEYHLLQEVAHATPEYQTAKWGE
jgi:hypothetical protein